MSDTATRTDRLQAAHEKLQDAVESIVSGEDWQRMLRTAAKFHRYSFQNQLLISFQNPDATLVAGFNKWKSMNRSVRKGEKGIAIFAPCKYRVPPENGPSAASPGGKGKVKDHNGTTASGSALAVKVAAEPNGEDRPKTVLHGFRIVHVFDISQTDGDPIEDLDAIRPKLLDGDAPEGIWDALVTQANAAGFEVVRDQKRNENGYCDFLNKKIAVRPDVSDAQTVKTLIHELGHALLHGEELPTSREAAEVEVESVAYIVCDALGLDTGDYSFAYVARWSDGSTELVKDTAERVVRCAKEILEGLGQSGENDADMEKAS
jgi:hypothetical protein